MLKNIYAVNNELPIRIELYDEEIDKIKEFDPISQRSLDRIDNVCITPTGFDPLIINKLLSIKDKDISSLFTEDEYSELLESNTTQIPNEITNTHLLGQVLYTDYIHIFQISGMILLIAMIGAIVLTFRQREGVKKQSYIKQISRERSEGVEVLDVPSNRGVKIDD